MESRPLVRLTFLIGLLVALAIIAIFQVFGLTTFGTYLAAIPVALGAGICITLWVPHIESFTADRSRARRNLESSRLKREFNEKMVQTVPPYLRDIVKSHKIWAVGPLFEVCSHSHLKDGQGWTLDQIRPNYIAKPAWIPSRLSSDYERFKSINKGAPENLETDLEKIMLVRPPTTLEKHATFPLDWTSGLYSEMRFFQVRNGATVGYDNPPDSIRKFRLKPATRRKALRRFALEVLDQDRITFPASLSIHCLTVTADEYLVVCWRGAADVAYFPNQWNLTLDENVRLKEDYLEPEKKDFIGNCIVRGLKQELVGLTCRESELLERDKIRLLSCFVEGNLPGVGICAYVPLRLTREGVEDRVVDRPDKKETRRIDYIPLDDVNWQTLRNPSNFSEGWGWGTPYALFMLKCFTEGEGFDALPPKDYSFAPKYGVNV